jgi:Domain of unknown function (DUF4276)
LVEGLSEAALLRVWCRRFLPGHTVIVLPHRGKGRLPGQEGTGPKAGQDGLLDLLPKTLKAFGRELNPQTDRVLVLLDLDKQNCLELESRLLRELDRCDPRPYVLFRIAIEETEAFYLGDRPAIHKAFPQAKLDKLRNYVQDSICGTSELFREVIGATGDDKRRWAEKMAPHLGTAWKGKNANASPSFRQLCKALLTLAGEPL